VVKAKRPEVLAIVPARGGSKSISRKNAKLFLGHPLLAYSIAAGLQAKSVSRVIVSTDDETLAVIARQYGAMPGARELGSVTDSYRSPEQQAAAYAAKPGVAAAPGTSYHQQGLAVDWGWASQQPELVRLLQAAGWNRFDPESEPWHWSFGVTG